MNIQEFAHKYLSIEILPHQRPWYDFIENNMYALLLAPREHGKSTTMRTWLLWRLCNNPNLRVLIASHKEELANEFARDILMQLEREDLQHDFGFSPGKPWRVGQAYLESATPRTTRKSTATLGTVAKLSGVTGRRFDIIVMDDPFDSKDVLTEKQRHKLKHWINTELFNCLDEDIYRKMVVIGTRKHIEDWYSELAEMSHWAVKREQLYTVKDGVKTYLWPERFNPEVEAIRRVQLEPDEFAMEFMNEPVAAEGLRFPRSWLKFYGGSTGRDLPLAHDLRYYMGIDPSMGKTGERTTHMGIVVVAFDWRPAEQKIYVVEMVRAKPNLAEQMELIKSKVREYNPVSCIIEYGIANMVFVDTVIREMPFLKKHNPNKALQGTSTTAKIARIDQVAGYLFKHGYVYLKDELVSPMTKMFVEYEYCQFPEGDLALMDALCMAVNELRVGEVASGSPVKLY